MLLRHEPLVDDDRPLDLDVRLHAPRAEVVIVHVDGVVDERSTRLLGERVSQQLDRATHVVLDLGGVRLLRRCGTELLLDLQRQACSRGTCLHIAAVEDAEVHDQLELAGLGCGLSADTVVALLPPRLRRRRIR